MTPTSAPAEPVESAEAELELDGTDGVLDLTDRRRVLLQVVFGVDVSPAELDGVFSPSSPARSTD